jgi:predicted ATPase/class 3 adenylate cyclase
MPEFPTGTVTFLFTDIEGSTKLLVGLGDRYADVLAEHRPVVREAIRAHRGAEMGTEGDAFFVAFASAADAVAAAADVQASLAEGDVRVRMGIHSGEPTLTGEGYVGLVLHETARICSAGHGGQVLLSAAARDLLGSDAGVRDLGEHRLKDIGEPMRLYQLGGQQFPALRTRHRTNLPVAATPLVGREAELEVATDLLLRDHVRLLTLTGPGGTGKTRLALAVAKAVADRFEDGVFFVPLAPIADPRLVLSTIAQTLEVRDDLATELSNRRALIVLDNFEQLTAAATDVAELLEAAPSVSVVATSREPLHIGGEHELPVPPLEVDQAVELFRARAYDAEPPEVVAEICRRLDGLPLAIELAAARTRSLAPLKLLERLDRRLPLLTGGPRDAPERQRTLRAAIGWSYDLLEEEERRLFRALSAFSGGWTLEAAEAICDADLDVLDSLVDKSLVRRRGERFTMLETIRQYAAERLDDAGEADDVGHRHAEWFFAFADERRRVSSRAALGELETELDNIRRVREWLRRAGEIEWELELAGAMARYYDARGGWREAMAAAEDALTRGGDAPRAARAGAWRALALAAYVSGDRARAGEAGSTSLELWREERDSRGVLDALVLLGLLAGEAADYERAEKIAAETRELALELGDDATLAASSGNLGLDALIRGDTARARRLHEEALEVFRRLGHERGVVSALGNLGVADLFDGRLQEAADHLAGSLDLAWQVGLPEGVVNALVGFAGVAAAAGDPARAALLLGAADAVRAETGGDKLEALEARIEADAWSRVTVELGDAAEAQRAAGAALPREQAIALARQDLDSQP